MRYRDSRIAVLIGWLAALSWTLLVVISLLKPGKENLATEYSMAAFFTSFFSYPLSGWDVIEAIYHILLFVILTAIWFWLCGFYFNDRKALLIALGIALALGTTTEISQYFVYRGSRLFDLLANYLGIALFVFYERQSARFKAG
ncbi:MAG: VanZ family protein [Gammaproteobacteria bacterium]|nr:VanZ family protein [Gammaproteobacteria bacterium]